VGDEHLDRLIDAWADRRAPELIERAETEALAAAARQLQGRLEAALLRAAGRRMAGPAEEHEVADAGRDPLVWVYGIVGADVGEAPVGEGVDGHPVTIHRRAGLGALISRVPPREFGEKALGRRLEDLEEVAGLARAHDRVLEAAASKGGVVPFRLCTIYSSIDRLDAMLESETSTLAATLRRLAGSQEWGVKAFAAPRMPVAADEPSPESGTAYLTLKRERRETADEERQAAETTVASIHARLAERAAAATVSAPHDRRLSGHDAEMLLNAAYLVPSDAVATFRSLVDQLAREHETQGLNIELTGPWPPYHFVDPPTHARDPR
jgi:hypothetical protein